jgi:hypothetical protein
MIVTRLELMEKLNISIGTLKKYEKQGLPKVIKEKPFRYDLDDVINWFKNGEK